MSRPAIMFDENGRVVFVYKWKTKRRMCFRRTSKRGKSEHLHQKKVSERERSTQREKRTCYYDPELEVPSKEELNEMFNAEIRELFKDLVDEHLW